MFFLLSKLLLWLVQPLVLVVTGMVGSLVAMRAGQARTAKRLLVGSVMIVIVAGVLPSSTALLVVLEDRFPRAELAPDAKVAGIIVLGGGEDARVTKARGVVSINESGERLTEAMSLARRYPAARVVFTGGSTEILAKPTYGTDAAELFFREQGLDMRRIVLERQSRNTYENAVYTQALVSPKSGEQWLLVTSAFHMPRSMGVFRQVRWRVLPWPVDYRTESQADALVPFLNPADGLKRFETAIKEWIGLTTYWLTGRSSSLFPGPEYPPRRGDD